MQTIRETNQPRTALVDPKTNVRVLLAVFWVCHFLLWTFGDAIALLQQMDEPMDDGSAALIIAPTTGIVQALMVVACLVALPKVARLANMIVAPIFLLFNIVFIVDSSEGWQYYLAIFYILFNAMILWHAYRWPHDE